MNKNIVYNFILIFTIIQCVESQDNDSDQPSDDEQEEEDNFDVLDLDKIIHERISRFDDPQYPTQPQAQPQHYDLDQEEYQYPTQPQIQPQQYPGYQPETYQYQPELLGYQPELLQYQHEVYGYEPQHYDQYQHEAYGYEPEQYDQYQPEAYGYEPEQYDQYQQEAYGYYETPTTQPSQQPEQYYGPPVTQPSQPSYQYYLPPAPQPQQPQYEYYQPTTTQSLTQRQQYDQYQPYGPPPPTPIQPSYQYYQPTTAPTTQPSQQPQYQYYQPTTAPQTSHTEITQSPKTQQTQSETEEDDDFYVTEHDQPIQGPSATEAVPESTQQSIKPQKKPRKRTRTKAQKSQVEEDECEGKKRKRRGGRQPKSYKKSIHIRLYKKNVEGNLLEMTEGDYVITHSDTAKSKYVFNTYLEQLQFDNEVIYIHIDGTPYCVSLIHGKKTNVFVMTNSYGFTLVKKVDGVWTRTDHTIPNYVELYKRDSGANEILMTNKDYNIDFTSLGSFRYDLNPDIKCYKIVVKDMIAWKKTDDDDGFPELIYVTPKFGVILKFNKYTKTFERRTRKYQFLFTKKNTKKGKYY